MCLNTAVKQRFGKDSNTSVTATEHPLHRSVAVRWCVNHGHTATPGERVVRLMGKKKRAGKAHVSALRGKQKLAFPVARRGWRKGLVADGAIQKTASLRVVIGVVGRRRQAARQPRLWC